MDQLVPEIAQTYLELRSRTLHLKPVELGLSPSNTYPEIWGVMMETGYQVGIATLVSLADGTTSLYYSTGGGLLGSPDYGPVAQASKALVAEAGKFYLQLDLDEDIPLPSAGQVRFTFLTYSGLRTILIPEKSLASGEHPLALVYSLGRETLTQLRLLAENKRK